LLDKRTEAEDEKAAKEPLVFSLDLDAKGSVANKTLAQTLALQLGSAMQVIKSAYLAINPAAKNSSAANAQAAAAYQSLLGALGGLG
jgi:hypothetical protein